ncbi:MAG: hypothetical protein ACKPKO_05830, partial [Candidatus Fonsibacter sp.]
EYQQRSMILRGRQIIWMMIDYFKTNRSLQEQYTWQDIELIQWPGDEKLQWFYSRWKLITTSLSVKIPEVVFAGYVPREDPEFQTPSPRHCGVRSDA